MIINLGFIHLDNETSLKSNSSQNLFNLIVDVALAFPFCFSVWIPYIVCSSIEDEYSHYSPYMLDSGPESITGVTSHDQLGDDMGRFEVERPQPPKRRKIGQGTMYELLFLMVSLIFWPITVIVTALLVGNIPTRYGTFNLEEHQLILYVVLSISLFSSYIVYRIDKEARSGEIYAKEKLAYHRDMDQYLELKRVYYETEAARVAGKDADE